MKSPDEDGSQRVMGDVAVLPAVHTGGVVDLEDNVIACELVGDGEEGENEADDLRSVFLHLYDHPQLSDAWRRNEDGQVIAEYNFASTVDADRSGAAVTATTVRGDTLALDAGETGTCGIRNEEESLERRASGAGRDE